MANDNSPRGLQPVNLGQGANAVGYYRVSTGGSTDMYTGCPVTLLASGYVVVASPTLMVPILGVAVGFAGPNKRGLAIPQGAAFLDVSQLIPPSPASETGDRYVLVAHDPQQLFLIQEDTGGTALALADVGAWCDAIYRGATAIAVNGDADNGWANIELDASGVVTTTAAPLRILGLADTVNTDGTNNAVGDYAKWIVQVGHHQRAGGDTNAIVV